jgi:hypothetical protein
VQGKRTEEVELRPHLRVNTPMMVLRLAVAAAGGAVRGRLACVTS